MLLLGFVVPTAITLYSVETGTVNISPSAEVDRPEDDPFGTVAITGGSGSFRAAGGQVALFDESVDDEQTLNGRPRGPAVQRDRVGAGALQAGE